MTTSSGGLADQPVGGTEDLSQEALDAIAEAAAAIERAHGTLSGQTALYWHLVSVARSHLKATGR